MNAEQARRRFVDEQPVVVTVTTTRGALAALIAHPYLGVQEDGAYAKAVQRAVHDLEAAVVVPVERT